MADLNLGPAQESSKGKAIGIATAVLLAIVAAVYFFAPHEETKVTVTHVGLVAPHIESKAMGGGIKVVGMPGESEDALYVALDLHIDNVRSQPLYLTGVMPKVVLGDGSEPDVTVVTPKDLPRVEPSFPALTPLMQHPLSLDSTIPAHGAVDGTVLLLLSGQTEAAWKTKKSAELTLMLANGNTKLVTLP